MSVDKGRFVAVTRVSAPLGGAIIKCWSWKYRQIGFGYGSPKIWNFGVAIPKSSNFGACRHSTGFAATQCYLRLLV